MAFFEPVLGFAGGVVQDPAGVIVFCFKSGQPVFRSVADAPWHFMDMEVQAVLFEKVTDVVKFCENALRHAADRYGRQESDACLFFDRGGSDDEFLTGWGKQDAAGRSSNGRSDPSFLFELKKSRTDGFAADIVDGDQFAFAGQGAFKAPCLESLPQFACNGDGEWMLPLVHFAE